jgi:glyoxylase-like metal-dependent hydrolase (beta-lactamase superfamily II)
MNTDRYRFTLGEFECFAILDFTGSLNAEIYFPNVSHSILHAENIDPESISTPGICLAVNTGADWVLLDTGLGFLKEDSKLKQILEEENIEPRHIILTHPDADHYGGLLNKDQMPVFPDAHVYMCRDEWGTFTSEAFYEISNRPTMYREHLLLLEAQVKLVDCDAEFLPGFRMIPLPGHTPHHVGIEIESNGEKLLFSGDVVCQPLHIKHLDWHFAGDEDHDIARESRIKFAQMASESGCLVLAFHFDFPGLGHVIQNGDSWKWQPLEL